MKKSFVAAIVLGALVFATAACGGGGKTNTEVGTPLVIERNDTPSAIESMSASDCSESTDLIMEGLDSINNTVPTLQYLSNAEVKDYLITAKSFIETSIESVRQCAYLSPEIAKSLVNSLNRVGVAIDDTLSNY